MSPGIGFGPGGEGFVRFALVENEQRIAQAVRGIRRALPELAATARARPRSGLPVPARHAVALGGVGDGGRDHAHDLAVEDARDDVLRPELVGADYGGDRALAASFIPSVMSRARTSSAPRKTPGNASTLLIWFG